MKKLSVFITVGTFGCLAAFGAIDLKESKFTQVVNDVQIISTADNSKHAASVDGLFKMPDVLRTGPASRAELVAADNTITRVGANTIFSFDAANRSIHLEQGSLLFNSPKGKGGGSIHTAAATAAVLGTTIIVTTTPEGGFKVLTLEGTAEVKFLSGLNRTIHAGQLIFVLPGGLPGPILSFRLDQQVANSRLVMGFSKPLASLSKVNAQISQQAKQIASGKATDTGMLVGNSATSTTVQVINPVAAVNAQQNAAAGPAGTPSNPTGTGSGGGTTTGGGTPVAPPPGVPTAPPGTIVLQPNGGYLTPDGFVFTVAAITNGGSGGPSTYAAGPANATLTDTTISSSTLDSSRVFTQAVTLTIPTDNDFDGTARAGFFARNIMITTPSIDYSPYLAGNFQNFVVFSSEDMSILNSLTLSTFNNRQIFFAGATLSISPGVTITGNAPSIEFGGRNSLAFNSVNFVNTGGGVNLETFNAITLNGVSINASGAGSDNDGAFVSINTDNDVGANGPLSLNNTTITGDSVDLFSSGTLTLTASTPSAGQISGANDVDLFGMTGLTVGVNLSSASANGEIDLETSTGQLTVNNGAQLSAQNININSGGDFLVDSIAPPSANFISASAVNTGTIQNTDMSNVGSLNVNAHTIVLNNVALPNSGNTFFTVANGVLAPGPNTGASVIPGDLNFIRNVTYHGALANTPGVGFNVGGPNGPMP